MTLFEECIEALTNEGEVTILSHEQSKNVESSFEKRIPFDDAFVHYKIDFSQMLRKKEIEMVEDILDELQKNGVDIDEQVYVIWSDPTLPVIKTTLKCVINVIYDVLAVSADTWIFCPKERYVVEFYHEGETFLGFY
jgi:repressor of nif and glnA expression